MNDLCMDWIFVLLIFMFGELLYRDIFLKMVDT